MKKPHFLLFFALIAIPLLPCAAQVSDGEFSAGVPEPFWGVWEKDDRYAAFLCRSGGEEERQKEGAAIYLKTFYSWHLDRSAEPEEFSSKRTANDSTCPEAERIFIEYRALETGDAGEDGASVWELFLWLPGLKEASVVPAAVIGGNLYLDFAVRLDSDGQADESDPLLGFWCKMASADGIKLCPPILSKDIYSTYITKDAVYTIRYWQTDMEYTNAKAYFSDGGTTFSVAKHIQSAGRVFTCANGRSVTIRNVQKTNDRPSVYELSAGKKICGLGAPYLKRVGESASEEALVSLAEEYYKKRAPNPNPPFPPSDLDWHLDDIRRLEAGNQIVEEARKRQREFAKKYPGRSAF